MNINYIPVMFYFIYLSIKARSFGFFSAADPGIKYGGMRGEPKYDILKKLPQKYYPTTIFIPKKTSLQQIKKLIKESTITYPLIAKPDIGERGICVKKINNEQQLSSYHSVMNGVDFMVQQYIPFDEEYAILHYRYPNQEKGIISSICKKEFLKIIGDGTKTVEELILNNPRSVLQHKRLKNILATKELQRVPKKNEVVPLENIGNHALGTEFQNYNHLINDKITAVFDDIEKNLDGIFIARYDLRCKSFEEMCEGKHIYIVEINGTGAEAAHIYDPNMTFFKRYKAMFGLWKNIYDIAKINHKNNVPYMSLKDIKAWQKEMKNYYPKIHNATFDF